MTNTCKYVFKKGKRKGVFCNDLCITRSSFCVKHHQQLKDHFQTPQIIRVEESSSDIKQKIIALNTTNDNKSTILKHYTNMKRVEPNTTEFYKNQIFIDLALLYPWDATYNVSCFLKDTDVKSLLYYIKTSLDKEIYGMENVKNEIINVVCKLITNPSSTRNNIALYGCAGVGKSKFIKVLSEALDIPMKVIALGGIKDSSFFLGHGYVYVESGPGKIIQNIIDARISNPIIYFDELDKISNSQHGKDIYSVLCNLTDPTQNNEFTDHYFYGMKFDLSKVLYVFTFNDITLVDKILLDRLNLIHVSTPSDEEICTIIEKHCIPEIKKNIGISKNITISTAHVKKVINMFMTNYDKNYSSGIREYYRIIEKIYLQINKDILLQNIEIPNDIHEYIITDTQFETYTNQIKQSLPKKDIHNQQHHHSMYT